MADTFADWQPRYAEHNIATFPVTAEKKPAVGHYLRLGVRGSGQLSLKFPASEAFGFGVRRSRITVLDVDTNDERVLADALSRHGPTPFIVRSGSGNFQAWYRNAGEPRKVRPDPAKPIDILGHGFVIAPPSLTARGRYTILQGRLDDLARLPRIRGVELAPHRPGAELGPAPPLPGPDPSDVRHDGALVEEGKRNDTLFRACLKAARRAGSLEKLMEAAIDFNRREFYRPLPAEEVLRVVASAWSIDVRGKNQFGYGPRVVLDADLVDDLAVSEPRAFALFAMIQRHHAGCDSFILAKGMAELMRCSVVTFRAARDVLVERKLIECIHPGGAGPNDPPVYRLCA